MKKAAASDKGWVVEILAKSFDSNKSVNFIVKQDESRLARIRALMGYSFDICHLFGAVFVSDDKKACALILYSERNQISLKSVWLNLKLIVQCIGLNRLPKILKREKSLKKIRPSHPHIYLWFIGVDPASQKMGIGKKMLEDIKELGIKTKKPIYLETSTMNNIPWYERAGFTIYNERYFGYKLTFMKKEAEQSHMLG